MGRAVGEGAGAASPARAELNPSPSGAIGLIRTSGAAASSFAGPALSAGGSAAGSGSGRPSQIWCALPGLDTRPLAGDTTPPRAGHPANQMAAGSARGLHCRLLRNGGPQEELLIRGDGDGEDGVPAFASGWIAALVGVPRVGLEDAGGSGRVEQGQGGDSAGTGQVSSTRAKRGMAWSGARWAPAPKSARGAQRDPASHNQRRRTSLP